MKEQIVIIGIVTLLVCVGLSGCSDTNELLNGPLYVGYDSDFQNIQDAIDAAKNGSTIIVKKGSYNELINLNKTITLIGEDKNTTIINFNPNYQISDVAIINIINADKCSIENLQITMSNNAVVAKGISINSDYNTIKNNIINNCINGIQLSAQSESNTIIHNEMKNNQIGIETLSSDNNNISHNILSNNQQYNIYLTTDSNTNKISFNIMDTSMYGIRIKGSEDNNVYKNCIQNNERGIYCCCGAKSNYIYSNTLLNNSINNAEEDKGLNNIWYDYPNGPGNYWDNYTGNDENNDGIGDTPYKIPRAGNQDIYPLMTSPLDVLCN